MSQATVSRFRRAALPLAVAFLFSLLVGTATPVRADTVDIHDIQGAAHRSPMLGQLVTVDGIVTVVRTNGFWMTDPEPDNDERTSEGIFVFRGSQPRPAVGQHVEVSGTVAEFRAGGAGGLDNLSITQITASSSSSTQLVLDSVPRPVPVTLVGPSGRVPPATVIDNDTTTGDVEDASGTVFDPDEDGIDFFESVEGMLIEIEDPVAVGPTNFFGEIALLAGGGAGVDQRTPRGGLHISAADYNPERIILDDALLPPNTMTQVNTGDTFAGRITGVVDYSFGNFKILVTEPPVREDNGLQREIASATGPRELSVATFNVLNLNLRSNFSGLADQIVNHLASPDLVCLQEVQDDSGPANNGTTDPSLIMAALIAAIQAAGGPAYEYRQIDPVDNADGGAPGSNIRVVFLFRTDRGLNFIDRPGGSSTNDTDVVMHPSGPRLTFSPGRIGTTEPAFAEARKPLAGEFTFRGEKLFVIGNHLSSKSDDDPLFGRFQPPIRYTEFENPPDNDLDGWRHGQAQVVNDFVDEILALDDDAHVIVLGDLNDFEFSATVDILTGVASPAGGPGPDGGGVTVSTGEAAVLTNLYDLLPANEGYTFVFDGNSQVLDHILVSDSLWQAGPSFDVVHVNIEFADEVSDHDPALMRVAFQPRRATKQPGD